MPPATMTTLEVPADQVGSIISKDYATDVPDNRVAISPKWNQFFAL